MLAVERRGRVLAAVVTRGTVRVTDLASELGVSEMTIRRDLDRLAAEGEVNKVHGGAVRTGSAPEVRGVEPFSALKAARERIEKLAIAVAALPAIEDGMTLAIGAGTTTLELARLLRGRDVSVVTNSVSIFHVLTDHAADDAGPAELRRGAAAVQLTGGQRTPSDALVGPVANASLERFRTDLAFLGAHGIDPTAGMTTPNINEAETNRRLIGTARATVLLVDHTKYGEIGAHLFAEFSRLDRVITDAGLSDAKCTELARRVDVTVAPLAEADFGGRS